jgi:hypothetical protein
MPNSDAYLMREIWERCFLTEENLASANNGVMVFANEELR